MTARNGGSNASRSGPREWPKPLVVTSNSTWRRRCYSIVKHPQRRTACLRSASPRLLIKRVGEDIEWPLAQLPGRSARERRSARDEILAADRLVIRGATNPPSATPQAHER